ncbi:MAG: glycoside hydrolase family 25 protein, partial [Rhizobiaceae bacterium]|nr:glycoside hydrolase family 25 protein [Rhizobiaceae bacterium]
MLLLTVFTGMLGVFSLSAFSSEFNSPWRDKTRGLVIDAYDKNIIDWRRMTKDRRIVGFIAKASDGLSARYGCKSAGNKTKIALCRKTWSNYSLKRELFNTRRIIAKSLGLKWGAYHLGRAGNPIAQANHFIDFAKPGPDDLIALDIEHGTGEKWISLKDGEIFARHIKKILGRYPMLYTNHATAKMIAADRQKYPILSRLKLWYPRYRPSIKNVFPLGNWENYTLWQFSVGINCTKRHCPYRVPGTRRDIDVNVTGLSIEALRKAWPFDGIWPQKPFPGLPAPITDNNVTSVPVTKPTAKTGQQLDQVASGTVRSAQNQFLPPATPTP